MASLMTENLKARIPWFVKVPAKIVLSRLPVSHRQWQRLNIFRAGAMDTPAYALDIFKKHYAASGFATLCGRTVVELGPGNSLLTGLYARSFGAARTWLVDIEELATQDTGIFAQAEKLLCELSLPVPGVAKTSSISGALERLNTVYLTQGLASLQTIPDGEVDLLFSQAVLEHIRRADFARIAKEMRRVLKPDGVASHMIDFRDHLQNGLNNLRFSGQIWESEFMARSGFYTNRLNWPAMERLFREAGFCVELRSFDIWPKGLPTRQRSMALPYKNMPPEELMVMGAHAIARPLS
jgi:SAM-dependent methyltransferase